MTKVINFSNKSIIINTMDFKTYAKNLPNHRIDLVTKLAELTCSSTVSVYRWINGDIDPPMIKKKIIAEHIGIPIEELFPPKKD